MLYLFKNLLYIKKQIVWKKEQVPEKHGLPGSLELV